MTKLLPFLLLLAACRLARPVPDAPLAPYFPAITPGDTLFFRVSQEAGDAPAARTDTIPNAVFFRQAPAALLREIDYVLDSSEAVVLGRLRFPVSDSLDAYLIDIRWHWFEHQSLLLYDRHRRAFTGRVTVAEWYGGDGGQRLIGSMLVDHDGDGDKDLVRWQTDHSLILTSDEPRDTIVERSIEVLRWDGGWKLENRN